MVLVCARPFFGACAVPIDRNGGCRARDHRGGAIVSLSLPTLLMLRRALLGLLAALDAALLEGYGWTPRGSKQVLDPRDRIGA